MAKQSDSAQLLAIGLLNYADDEGFFFADARLIRAQLRPFDEDSKNVLRSIQELSRIGYLEVVEHSTHGAIGRIVSFLEHQRIDKPRKSTIRPLFEDSKMNPRTIQEESQPEGKGMERNGSRNGKESLLVESAKELLHLLNEQSGRKFRETETNLTFIRARLAEDGVTVDGVKEMVVRQCEKWKGTEQSEYLRPETLFNKTKFDSYYAARELPIFNHRNGKPPEEILDVPNL